MTAALELDLDIAAIPAPVRAAADILADRSREIGDLLAAGRVTPEWAQPRMASIAIALAALRHPAVALCVHEEARDYPDVRYVRGGAA